jgi:hypothetical protein
MKHLKTYNEIRTFSFDEINPQFEEGQIFDPPKYDFNYFETSSRDEAVYKANELEGYNIISKTSDDDFWKVLNFKSFLDFNKYFELGKNYYNDEVVRPKKMFKNYGFVDRRGRKINSTGDYDILIDDPDNPYTLNINDELIKTFKSEL